MYLPRLSFMAGCFLVLLTLPGISQATFITTLSDIHVQSALQQHFPLREYTAFARVTLHEPQVQLSQGTKEIMIIVPVDVNISDQGLKQGHATVAVGISYKPISGGLYLSNPRLVEFELPSVEKAMSQKLQPILDTIFKNALPLVQIYKVNEHELNHSLAKSVLKSAVIGEGNIKLEFGFE